MKIVFLGDSLTWGRYGGSFVDEVARLLPAHTIINEGVSGNTVLNLLSRLNVVLDHQPEGVFVMAGGNDALSYCQPGTRRYYEKMQNVPGGLVAPDLFAQSCRELLTQLHLHHILVWVGLPPCEYSPLVVQTYRLYNDLCRQAAQTLNIPVLDLMAHFVRVPVVERPPLQQAAISLVGVRSRSHWADYENERRTGGFTFTFDGLHLMPESAQEASRMIVDFLNLE